MLEEAFKIAENLPHDDVLPLMAELKNGIMQAIERQKKQEIIDSDFVNLLLGISYQIRNTTQNKNLVEKISDLESFIASL